MDTSQGPYFVPGRVVDLPNGQFKFFPGEIIESESGPRYVAPYETDLVSAADDGWDDDEGSDQQQQVLVQGFPVSPEELRLITAYPYAALHYPANDSSALINSRMLKQMAAAGVAVHQITNTSNSANDNAGIDDVKINAPNVDEAILGADIFRTTDPVPVPTKIRRVSKVPPPPPVAPPMKASIEETLPTEVVVFEKQLLRLSVKVDGNPPPEVKWFKDGKPLAEGDSRVKIQLLPGGIAQLEVESADASKDSGVYKLVASNSLGDTTTQTKVEVKKTPVKATIEESLPEKVSVFERQMIRLSVKVSGNPLPEIQWFKNDKPLNDGDDGGRVSVKLLPDGTAQLEIEVADPKKDIGIYKLVAKNASGEVTTQTKVEINKTPVKATLDTSLPPRMIVVENQLLRLTAKISGNPLPEIKWFKDGEEIADDRINIQHLPDGTAQLEIICADFEKDSGTYKLTASNPVGASTTETKVEVVKAPKTATIDEPLPSEVIVAEGQLLRLVAKVSGNPLPDVTWFKSGIPLAHGDDGGRVSIRRLPDGSSILEIPSADPEKDSSLYKFVVSNSMGESTSETNVDVQKTPKQATINQFLPQELIVFEKQLLRLAVPIDGHPPPEVKWFKDGKPLAEGDSRVKIQLLPDGTAQLEVESADASKDSGVYKLIVSNSLGNTTTQTKVEVNKTPRKATLDAALPEETSVIEQEPLRLSAKVSGNPLPEIKWLKDDKPIADGGRISIQLLPDGTAQFEIPSADIENDSGIYKLVAKNASGEVATQTKVTVNKTPKQATLDAALPAQLSVIENQLLRLTAKISGNPLPEIKWFKNGKQITGGRIKIQLLPDGTAQLEIESATLGKDSAIYKLVAKNAIGEVATETKVTVEKAPKAATLEVALPSELIVIEHQALRLRAKVDGNPPPEVNWFKDEKKLKDGDDNGRISIQLLPEGTAQLEIASADPKKDSGVYKLVATNPSGDTTSETKVDVQKAPKKATIEELLPKAVTVFEKQLLRLSVKVSGNPLPEVKWFRNGKLIADGDDGGRVSIKLLPEGIAQLEVESADASKDSGAYKLVVSNAHGDATTETKVEINKTLVKATLDAALQAQTTVIEQEPLRLSAKVSGNPLPEIKWFKDGKPIVDCRINIKLLPDGTAQLEIASADLEKDSGIYKLVAVNKSGEAETQTKVTVEKMAMKATIEEPLPAQVSVVEAKPLILTAKVAGNPPPDVNWFKDEKKLNDGDDNGRISVRLSPEGTAELKIAAADPKKDSGLYKMVASNTSGETKTETFVQVEKAPQKATIEEQLPGKVVVFEKQLLRLSVKVEGNPPPEVKWFKDGKQIAEGDSRVKIQHLDGIAQLEVESADALKDSGVYKLVVSNSLGDTTTQTKVEVNKTPKKATLDADLPEKLTVSEKQLLRLSAKVSGNPLPEIQWFKNDKPLNDGDDGGRVSVKLLPDGTAQFQIEEADPAKDPGIYKLVAKNASGEVATQTKVEITKTSIKPTLDAALPSHMSVIEEEPLILSAKISGNPLPEIKWYKDKKLVTNGGRISVQLLPDGTAQLEIAAADIERDSGVYRLVARNASGDVKTQTKVEVKKAPVAATFIEPLPKKVNVVQGEPLRLTAIVAGDPPLVVQWTNEKNPPIETDQPSPGGGTFVISSYRDGTVELEVTGGGKLADSGSYSLVVSNHLGKCKCETQVEVYPGFTVAEFFRRVSH